MNDACSAIQNLKSDMRFSVELQMISELFRKSQNAPSAGSNAEQLSIACSKSAVAKDGASADPFVFADTRALGLYRQPSDAVKFQDGIRPEVLPRS